MTAMTQNSEAGERPESDIRKRHAEMLEAAMSRPGIPEVMKVYGGWKEQNRRLDASRAAMKRPARVITADRSNPD